MLDVKIDLCDMSHKEVPYLYRVKKSELIEIESIS